MNVRRARYAPILAACLTAGLLGCASSKAGPSEDELKSVAFLPSDFPPSWVGDADTDGVADLVGLGDSVASCIGADLERIGKPTRSVRSLVFQHGRDQAASTAVAFSHPDDLGHRLELLGSTKAEACLSEHAETVLHAIDPDATVLTVSVTSVAGGVNVAANVAGTVTGTITLTTGGRTVTRYIDATFLTGRLLYTELTFVGEGRSVNQRVRTFLVNSLSTRTLKS